jgi:very-short-patch-repair endonuclease
VGLGRFHVREDHSSGYAVDLSLPEHRIAIEVDGPSHMARNHYERLLGHTSLKRRHLEGLGWKVTSFGAA